MTAPSMWEKVDPLIKAKLALAQANPGVEVNVAINVSQRESNDALAKLRAMRKGLIRYQPKDSELWRIAQEGYMKFARELDRGGQSDSCWTVYMIVYALEDLRPSAAAAKAIDDFKKGLRSSPF